MRGAAEADERGGGDLGRGREGDGSAHGGAPGRVLGEARARAGLAARGQEVGRGEDLAVVVVGGAVAAEAAAGGQDAGVGEEDGEVVVDAGEVALLQLREGVGVRVVELGDKLHVLLVEGDAEGLAAHDEDLSVRQHGGGVEDALRVHRPVLPCEFDLGYLAWLAQRDDMGVGRSPGALVVGGPADG